MEEQSAHLTAQSAFVRELARVNPAINSLVLSSGKINEEDFARAHFLAHGAETLDQAQESKQLQSVFSLLSLMDKDNRVIPAPSAESSLLPLNTLSLQHIFPIKLTLPEKDIQSGIQGRWTAFTSRLEVFRQIHQTNSDVETYLESIVSAARQELWCVSSGISGASLFDSAHSTAAIAVCLTRKNENGTIATLIGGDISGIQDFIYTITSKGAASALRGRSLYLQLLTDAIARFVLRGLDLPITNLLFSGGGHFYILARPNAKVKSVQQTISRILLSLHSGELYLALESVSLSETDFAGEALTKKWSVLSERLRQAKLKKFGELEEDLYSSVFVPRRDQGNEEKECAVCGREHPGTEEKHGRKICPQCESYEKLGKDLRQAQFLRTSEVDEIAVKDNMPPAEWNTALAYFGVRAGLYDSVGDMKNDGGALQGVKRSVVHALIDKTLESLRPDSRTAVGRRFLVNVTPLIRNQQELDALRELVAEGEKPPELSDVKPFELLGKESRGIERLGVLRMDVDSMGTIISTGLGDQANLARIANLSFMINLFFEGWAAEAARKYNVEGGADTDSVYSIYSGGDDLFFVGAWDRMPELALDIRNGLQKFTANHAGIHASAGIALVNRKYPLYQAAEDAHEALEKSKSREGKNSITFLNQTMDWDTFANEVKPRADELKPLVQNGSLPNSMLRRLQRFQLQFHERQEAARARGEAEDSKGEEQVVWGPWNWHAAYFLAKSLAKAKRDTEDDAQIFIEDIREKISDDKFRAIEWVGFMARWVDLLTRNEVKKGELAQ